MHKKRTLTVILLALAMAGTGCMSTKGTDSQNGKPASKVAPESTSIILRDDVDTYDPYKSILPPGALVLFDGIYDTLVRRTLRGGAASSVGDDTEVTPALAKSWVSTPTSATFTLKDGLTCGDGSPLAATDIAKSLARFADPKTGAQMTTLAFGPSGAKSVVGDNAAKTVTITLNKPYAGLVNGMADGYVICPSGMRDLAGLAKKPAESGPYQLTSSKRGDFYTVTRRADAAIDDPKSLPKTIKLQVVADDTTRANLIDTGAVDIGAVLGPDAKRLETTHKAIVGAASIASALLFNQKAGHPTADPRLREAMAYAVDAASYVQAATFGAGQPTSTMYTPNTDCYTKANGSLTPPFNLKKAKELLKAAGYGPGGKTLQLRAVGIDTQNSGPEYIADALRKAGATVSLRSGTLDKVIGIVFGEDAWEVMVFPYEQSSYSPVGLVGGVSNAFGETLNVGGIKNSEYDKLAIEASAKDGEAGCALWGQAEAALLRNVDVKPLSWSRVKWFGNKGLTFTANSLMIDTRSIRTAG